MQSFPCFLVEAQFLSFPEVSSPGTAVLAGNGVKVGVGPGVGWAVPSVSLSPVEAAPADSVSFPFLESSR